MMPTLAHFGVGSIPWSPLARGLLTRPWAAPKTLRQNTDIWLSVLAQGEADKTVVNRCVSSP